MEYSPKLVESQSHQIATLF